MNLPLALIACVLVIAQFSLPLRWAYLPLLVAACNTPHFGAIAGISVARLVIIAGLLRAIMTGKASWSIRNPLDTPFVAWSVVALLSGIAHNDNYSNPFVYRAGLVISVFGTYMYAKTYFDTKNPLRDLALGLVIAITPLAILMSYEVLSGSNFYSMIGARLEEVLERGGRSRASGPFATPILAGTVAALTVPLILPFIKNNWAKVGLLACVVVTFCSASSTPIGSLILGLGSVALWKFRGKLRLMFWGGLCVLVVLHFIKERPIWYLIALVDFVGGSTGYHRSLLIDSGIKHIGEWWLAGTDYTRHWMPYGLPMVPDHVDLTNYFLFLGVVGGLPLTLVTIEIFRRSFRALGSQIDFDAPFNTHNFSWWCGGSTLFAHCFTALTISYFDNSYVFLYALIGVIAISIQRQYSGERVE